MRQVGCRSPYAYHPLKADIDKAYGFSIDPR
jgi:hypothetical protein